MTLTQAIELSLRTFACGVVGVVPIAGVLPSLHALRCWRQVRRQHLACWNPASRYLWLGGILAIVGILGTILALAAICYSIIVSYW